MDLRHKMFVVGYWSNVVYVTDDEKEANDVMINHRIRTPHFPWSVRTIEEAVRHAYNQGMEDA